MINNSEAAIKLRSTLLLLRVGHIASAIIAVALIGDFLMCFAQVIYIAMLYSVYLALHRWLIWVYMVFTGLNGLHGLLGIFS